MLQSDSPLQVSTLAAGQHGAWDDFARNHGGSVYHDTRWQGLIERVFKHRTHYLYAHLDGDIQGILPLVHMRHIAFGSYLVSLPFLTYGGAVAKAPKATEALLAHAAQLASELGCSHVETRDLAPLPVDWPARTDKISMVRELPDDPVLLDKAIGSKLRAQVKRPRREGATAHVGGIDLLDEFYHVFAVNMRDLGTPVYSRALFAQLLVAFPEQAAIVVVRVDEKPAAAGFLLRNGDTMEIPWASSLRRYNRISVNMLLYWEVLVHCIEMGCTRFDFGRTSEDSNTHRFKRQWGAEPVQLYWHYWLRDSAAMPGLTPSNPKFKAAIAVWQKLPLPVANALGPHIVRGLP